MDSFGSTDGTLFPSIPRVHRPWAASEARNIVTISYFGTNQSGFQEWVHEHDHDGANDTANEVTAMQVVIDQTTGFSPLVSGTVREDGEFDLFAMRINPNGSTAWTHTYDDPFGTDDECTGLAHNTVVNNVNSAGAIVAICGQVGTETTDETVYLTLALNFADGTEYWDVDGTFGRGRAWNVEATAEGFDYPVDISYGPGPSAERWVWVTGHGHDDDSLMKIGTIAYPVTDPEGDLVAEHVFFDSDDEDEEDFAVELQVDEGGEPTVFVTGYTESPSALPGYLTLHLEGDPLDTEAYAHYYGHDYTNLATACWLDQSTVSLLVAGWTVRSSTGQNWGTTKYNP